MLTEDRQTLTHRPPLLCVGQHVCGRGLHAKVTTSLAPPTVPAGSIRDIDRAGDHEWPAHIPRRRRAACYKKEEECSS